MDEAYTISMERTRVLAARSGFVKIGVKKRYEKRTGERCPVCRSALRDVRNRSLTGGEVVVGHRCTLCGYRSKKNQGPLQYSFHLIP